MKWMLVDIMSIILVNVKVTDKVQGQNTPADESITTANQQWHTTWS